MVSTVHGGTNTDSVIRTYRYRLYPNARQVRALNAQLAFNCDLYNAALEQNRTAWRLQRKSVSLNEQMRDLTDIRAAGIGPIGMACEAQRDPLRRLNRAFAGFFRRVKAGESPGFPRFRSSRRYNSITWPINEGAVLHDGRVRLLGIGAVRMRWHRDIPTEATVRIVTVTRLARHWYVCFAVKMPPPAPVTSSGTSIGVDLGVAAFAALSTGELVLGPRAGDRARNRTRRLQRKLSRCRQGSQRRRKAVKMLRRLKEREAAVRKDHRHKVTTDLVRRFGTIYVEDLQIANMVRSAKGTAEALGRNVRQKAGLNRAIHDQGWGLFLRCLEYKAEDAGTTVIRVPAAYTSQTCGRCHMVDGRSRVSQASFACVECGQRDHADVNAAKNIEMAGRAIQAPTVEHVAHAVA